MALLESVPNVSEGCDPAVIEAVADAFAGRGRVLDVHSDPEHHRSVYTIVADEDELASALLAGIARAAELIDLREHVGIHPRVGAADVVPIVPLVGSQMQRAREVAIELGERVGGALALPVFLYGESADGRAARLLPQGWDGGVAKAHRQRRAATLVRPADARPKSGRGADRRQAVADRVQPRAPHGWPRGCAGDRGCGAGVGWWHGRRAGARAAAPDEREVQVSINVIDTEKAPLADVVARVREAAAERGADVGASELVGLLPQGAVADPALLGLHALTDAHVLERRIAQE